MRITPPTADPDGIVKAFVPTAYAVGAKMLNSLSLVVTFLVASGCPVDDISGLELQPLFKLETSLEADLAVYARISRVGYPWVERWRPVTINPGIITPPDRNRSPNDIMCDSPKALAINVFDDAVFVFKRKRVYWNDNGSISWTGEITGDNLSVGDRLISRALLIIKPNGNLYGSVTPPRGPIFRIEAVIPEQGIHGVFQRFPLEGGFICESG